MSTPLQLNNLNKLSKPTPQKLHTTIISAEVDSALSGVEEGSDETSPDDWIAHRATEFKSEWTRYSTSYPVNVRKWYRKGTLGILPTSENERLHYLKIMRTNWASGLPMELSEMLDAQFFGEEVPKKLYEKLTELSGRTKGERGKATALLAKAKEGAESKVLGVKDVEAALVLLGPEMATGRSGNETPA